MRVLVTGASGFVGSHLVPLLLASGHDVTAATRAETAVSGAARVVSPDLGPDADWRPLLAGVEAVVHLAARAHVPSEVAGPGVESLYHRINADGTRAIARQAREAGVRHFVLMSSTGAVASASDGLITADTPPRPVTAYGRSKLAAEAAVREEFGVGWTILRPPLVYGPGNRANFDRLVRLVRSGLPLPLAGVRNRRSFLHVGNLADAVLTCLGSPGAGGRTYLLSDGADVSTPELIRRIARVQGRQARMFALPPGVLRSMTRLPGGRALGKLMSSLFVDSAPIRQETGWVPRFTLDEGLATLGGPAS